MGLSLLERSRLADALDLWRAGERHVTRRLLTQDWHDDYQAAVQAARAYLQRYATMADLLVAYFDLDDDAWLDTLCRRPSGRILNVGDMEDRVPTEWVLLAPGAAAHWRRGGRRRRTDRVIPADRAGDAAETAVRCAGRR